MIICQILWQGFPETIPFRSNNPAADTGAEVGAAGEAGLAPEVGLGIGARLEAVSGGGLSEGAGANGDGGEGVGGDGLGILAGDGGLLGAGAGAGAGAGGGGNGDGDGVEGATMYSAHQKVY